MKLKQLNISDLQERAKVSFELNHDEETAWVELKTFYLENHEVTIPECGIKQVFINILRTLHKKA